MKLWRAFRHARQLGKSGATAIEYAFIGALISIAAFSVLVNVGTSLADVFQQVANSF